MTRVCIVGNSHIGSMRQSKGLIAEKFPDITVKYFGAPGRLFADCMVDENGNFGPKSLSDADEAALLAVNGALNINFDQFDIVLITGYGFNFGYLLRLLYQHDILDTPKTNRTRVCSQAFFEACTDAIINEPLDVFCDNLGRKRRYVMTPAPYPSQMTVVKGPGYRPTIAHLKTHPEGTQIFENFLDKMEKAVLHRGIQFMRQPQQTVAGPFLTRRKFAKGAVHVKDDSKVMLDHNHMNGDYGLAVFEKFAQTYLTSLPGQTGP